jgi:GTP pyrophosphokinase
MRRHKEVFMDFYKVPIGFGMALAQNTAAMSRYAQLPEAQKQEILTNVGSRMGIQSADDLYNMIGYGGLSVSKISIKLHDEFERIVKSDVQPVALEVEDIKTKPRANRSGSGVIIDGLDGCAVKFAKCCNPLPGDKIIGFVTKGYGVSVHKRECHNITTIIDKPQYDGRFVTAHWEESTMEAPKQTYEAYIQIQAENSLQLLANITAALADMRVALHSINTQTKPDNEIIINLIVGCKNIEHYHSIVARLKTVPNVSEVVRGYA